MNLQVGQLLDSKYEIKRLLGKGGMGNVYEGENVLIHRRVAIKILNADIAKDVSFAKRFEREAQAAGRIGSDHIVEVLDLGTLPSGERYMVMEYLRGESFRDRMLREGAMPPQTVFPILLGVLEGLGEAHAAGILHRDLKPANIFLTDDRKLPDFVKILDFGVSKFLELDTDDPTATGVTLGTPRYMAPEQAKGEKDIDARADLYSVGVVLFRALTGRPPFIADTYNELMFKVVLEDAPSLSELVEDADPRIVRLVAKALEREREKRYQSADEMAAELREWLERHGHELPVQPSAKRAKLNTLDESETRISIPEFPIEPTSTKHAATIVTLPQPRKKRRPWLLLAALASVAVVALTTVRVLQVLSEESSAANDDIADSASPTRPAAVAPSELDETVADASSSTVPPAPTPSASPSTEPAPSASASSPAADASDPPVPTPTFRPGVTKPSPKPQPSGPIRRYRRKL